MSHTQITEIKSVTSAIGNWYQVSGPKSSPFFERVVLWGVVHVVDRSSGDDIKNLQGVDVIVGFRSLDLGVVGSDTDELLHDVAGYIEATPEEIERIKQKPELLSSYVLVWEE